MRHLLVGFSLCILSTACVEEEQQERILTYIQESCTERKEICEVWEYNGNMMVQAEKTLKIGGATVFISEVNQIMKF